MSASAENRELFRRARRLAAEGRSAEAEPLLRRVVAADPEHADALSFLGLSAYRRGDHAESEHCLRKALALRPEDPILRQNLGLVFKARGDLEAALGELDGALAARPALPMAHLHRGALLARQGRPEEAADALARAVALNPNLGDRRLLAQAPEEVVELVRELESAREEAAKAARRRAVDALAERFDAEELARARRFVEVFNGERAEPWAHELQTPSWMYFPGLEPRPWYEREAFEWVGQVEAAAARVRAELEAVIAESGDIAPYVPEQQGLGEDWRRLAGTTNWGSYHLWRGGARQDAHCRACPETAALLESLPLMDASGHAPEAFFSILQPGTHIPPHVGLANTKLAVHLPLIIPPGCSITVGGETRSWVEGEVLVFDDSFRHEARNDSDSIRAVLIFEVWNPGLSEAEREAVRAVIDVGETMQRHYRDVARDIRSRIN